jgi:flagellar biosynthesis chaperone FliJ
LSEATDQAHSGLVDVDAVVELYGLPPDRFTTARNRLVAELKERGDTNRSAAVKALRKPTTAAWLANHLVRVAPDRIAELTEFGDELRAMVLAGDGAGVRRLTPRRHDLVQRLVVIAKAEASTMGRTVTTTVAERLAETLDSAMVDPEAAKLLRSGQLTSALRHIGFGVVDERGEPVTAEPPRVAKGPSRTTTPTRTRRPASGKAAAAHSSSRAEMQKRAIQRQRSELEDRLREVEAEYVEAENLHQTAESELDANEHHIADMQTAIERLTNELDQARRELRKAQSQTRKLEKALTRAERNAASARRRRDAQRERLAVTE